MDDRLLDYAYTREKELIDEANRYNWDETTISGIGKDLQVVARAKLAGLALDNATDLTQYRFEIEQLLDLIGKLDAHQDDFVEVEYQAQGGWYMADALGKEEL